jgi:hypothetical protein
MLFHQDGSVITMMPGGNTNAGVFRSTDGCNTWLRIFPSIQDPSVLPTDYFALNIDDLGQILIGTDSGVLRLSGFLPKDHWANVSSGLNWDNWDSSRYVNTSDLVQDVINRRYYAATRGLSVFESTPDLKDAVRTVTASTNSSIVNYPNPFATQTTIAFHQTSDGTSRLDVYDVMGRLVATAANEFFASGDHSVSFDAKNLPNGNYLVVLRAGSDQWSVVGGRSQASWMTISK